MWPKPKTVLGKEGVENGREHLGDGLLDNAVTHRRDAELAFTAIRFIDFDAFDRRGVIATSGPILPK